MKAREPVTVLRWRCDSAAFQVQPAHMNPLETYFRNLRDIHAVGAAVPETSYCSGLESLLNEISKQVVEVTDARV